MEIFNQIVKKISQSPNNLIYLLFPIVSSYILYILCPIKKSSGSKIKFRPPTYVFQIVWPILYLLIGSAWILSLKNTIWYFLLSLCLASWTMVYSCLNQKKLSIFISLLSLILTLTAYTVSNNSSKLLLVPLLGWLIFALIMNAFDITYIH